MIITTINYGKNTLAKTIRFQPDLAEEELPVHQTLVSWAEEVEETVTNPTWTTRSTPRKKNKFIPLKCCICNVKRSQMSALISPHEEYGQHTAYYCSRCHRETFEEWYREQEQYRQGKWTGTKCLACQQILERTEYLDVQDIGGTCSIDCHMAWQIYVRVRRGQDIDEATNIVSIRFHDYPMDEEESTRKAKLLLKREKEVFHNEAYQYAWEWELRCPLIRENEHWSKSFFNKVEELDRLQLWIDGLLISPNEFDFEAELCKPENVIGNLEMAPTQAYFGDWEKPEELLIDIEKPVSYSTGILTEVYFHKILEEIPEDEAALLQEPIQPFRDPTIKVLVERDLLIGPRIARKWESEFVLPSSPKY
jgi:hypothetical protein